jgi:iron complex outermembrane receptor protein/vitamin B12 transporter
MFGHRSRLTGIPVVFTCLALGLFSSSSSAQSNRRIAGAVSDPLDAPIAGAKVELLRDATPVATATTSADGAFFFDGLAESRYQVRITAAGFQSRTSDPIFVGRAGTARADLTLPLGPLETAVSVTAAATDVLPSQVGAAVTVFDGPTLDALGKLDIIEALRLVPGSSLVQTGGRGGVTSDFVRGGNSNFNRVLIDGVPVNDIGGAVDLAQFALAGIDQLEVLRQANSVITGPDALAGVIAATTKRGTTRVPQVTLGLNGGTLGTHQESAGMGGVLGRVDYFSELAHFSTRNDQPNNDYKVNTYAGRFGAAIGQSSYLSATVRWLDKYYASPNGVNLFGTPDDAWQTSRMYVVGIGDETQISDKWSASARLGLSDQRARFFNPTTSGTVISGIGFGDVMTITGANRYSATGRGILDYGPYDSPSRSARQGIYAQTTYQISHRLTVSGGGNYEREQAYADPGADPTTTRHNGTVWAEGRTSVFDRISVTAGVGYAHLDGYASRFAPRLSLAALLRKPAASSSTWHDTRLTFNAGRGVKSTSATSVDRSLYKLLLGVPDGEAIAAENGIGPIGPERGRNLDVGIEQGLLGGRVRARITYFNNQFFDLIEFVSRNQLPAFGVPPEVAALVGSGAYVNSQSYRAQGGEVSVEARLAHFRFAASYTRLDAEVTASLSSNVTPQVNPNIPGVPIGGFTALVGQRPFRRPVNTGNLLVAYTRGRATGALSAYVAGKADDSTFLVGADQHFGNTLLLPNQDLNFGYAKVDVSSCVQLLPRVKWFATIENLLDDDYQAAFGFPALPINFRTGIALQFGGR